MAFGSLNWRLRFTYQRSRFLQDEFELEELRKRNMRLEHQRLAESWTGSLTDQKRKLVMKQLISYGHCWNMGKIQTRYPRTSLSHIRIHLRKSWLFMSYKRAFLPDRWRWDLFVDGFGSKAFSDDALTRWSPYWRFVCGRRQPSLRI